MRKYGAFILAAAFLVTSLVQLRTALNLRRELETTRAENERLQRDLTGASEPASIGGSARSRGESAGTTNVEANRLQELQSEVMRLRGLAARALQAEAQVAQLQGRLDARERQGPGTPSGGPLSDAGPGSSSNVFLSYLGDAVPAPVSIDPAYTKEGLVDAIQRAAAQARVSIKKLQIDNSEFPFLAGVMCDSDAEFEKLKEQFKTMAAYQYGGATSSHGTYAFNITPYRAYPPDAGQRISRRTTLRQQILFDQLNSAAN